jgi:hypothetical protein
VQMDNPVYIYTACKIEHVKHNNIQNEKHSNFQGRISQFKPNLQASKPPVSFGFS